MPFAEEGYAGVTLSAREPTNCSGGPSF